MLAKTAFSQSKITSELGKLSTLLTLRPVLLHIRMVLGQPLPRAVVPPFHEKSVKMIQAAEKIDARNKCVSNVLKMLLIHLLREMSMMAKSIDCTGHTSSTKTFRPQYAIIASRSAL